MSVIRAWYSYNPILSGGVLNSNNYSYVSWFPFCQTTGNQICCVYGIFDDGLSEYWFHPKPFSFNMEDYINTALAFKSAYPFFQHFVYVQP
jgi:hypothetical protein